MHSAPMRIDWHELEAAFTFASPENCFFLFLDTGEIVFMSDDMDQEEREELEERINGPGSVEVKPPESHEKWRWMADFTETVEDDHLRELLEVALQGKGAFRRFKDVLLHAPPERERWFRYEAQKLQEAIDRWVARHHIEVENSPPWADQREASTSELPVVDARQ